MKREQRFPEEWFLVGEESVIEPTLHTKLKNKFGSKYVSGFEEGEYGYLCLKNKDSYIAVTTDGWGVGADYSKTPPKCLKCNTSSILDKEFRSGSGLYLGQTIALVSAIIQAPFTSDVVTVSFEHIVAEPTTNVRHTEVLRIEFADDVLIRFSIHDYEEFEESE